MSIEFVRLDDTPGIRVLDHGEGEQFDVHTDAPVDPAPADADAFDVPVDEAVAIEAREFHVPSLFTTAVFWRDGDVVARAAGGDPVSLDPAVYEIDISPPSAKLYVRVESAAAGRFADDHTYLEFDAPTRVLVGVRSYHRKPQTTVTTTDDPRDLMRAVSTFGSALKTHSPGRSWPTLRGHPPALRRGDELDAPADPPDTGVTIEVPPAYAHVYAAAPLAFYLGATLEPGTDTRLAAGGSERAFEPETFGREARDLLQHVFTLDCVVRSAGRYPFRTPAMDALDDRVALDYDALYDTPLAERTAAYLDVPRAATADLLDWHITADVDPDPAYAVALPHLLDELALVRSPASRSVATDLTPEPDALREFYHEDAVARSASDAGGEPRPVVVPEPVSTPGHAWVADGFPVGAAKPTVGSLRRTLDRTRDADGITISVVYNDERMQADGPGLYGRHPLGGVTVHTAHSLTTAELRDELHRDADLFHFVGHVNDDGMVCPDGALDVRTLATTGVDAFFLNGCRSYEQGRALLTAGSVGGIVTVDDVYDAEASRIGYALAVLLDAGFPLYGAVSALEHGSMTADRYTIIGNGAFALRRAGSGTPILYEFDTDRADPESGRVEFTAHYYPYGENGMGALVTPMFSDGDSLLAGGHSRQQTMSWSALGEELEHGSSPVFVDDELRHTDDLSLADFQ